MNHLLHSEVEMLLSALAILHSEIEPSTLPDRATKVINNLISNEIVAFDFLDQNGGHTGKYWYNPPDMISESEFEIFAQHVHEHPFSEEVFGKMRRDSMKISDFLSLQKFHKTAIYNEYYKLYRIDHQMAVTLPESPESVVTCALSRTKKDFTERDRLFLSLLTPHLTNALRNARTFERIKRNEERLMSIVECMSNGVIALDADKKVQYISEHAKTLLEKYFDQERLSEKSLPDDLQQWILNYDPLNNTDKIPELSPFVIERENSVLKINLMVNSTTKERTLLLEERALLSPSVLTLLGLTKREAEILFLMAKGKTDKEIAILSGISVYTVQKHAQHIYQKLGVETRTAAMLRAIEVLEKII